MDSTFSNNPTHLNLPAMQKSILMVLSWQVQDGEKLESLDMHIPRWVWTRWCSAYYFSFVNKCRFYGLHTMTRFSYFCVFFLVGLLFQMAALSIAPKCYLVFLSARRVWCASWKKIYALAKLHSSLSYSAVGCEFYVNDSIIYII